MGPRRLIASDPRSPGPVHRTQQRIVSTDSVPCHTARSNDQLEVVVLAAEWCANSPPHPSRQRACHCAAFG